MNDANLAFLTKLLDVIEEKLKTVIAIFILAAAVIAAYPMVNYLVQLSKKSQDPTINPSIDIVKDFRRC